MTADYGRTDFADNYELPGVPSEKSKVRIVRMSAVRGWQNNSPIPPGVGSP